MKPQTSFATFSLFRPRLSYLLFRGVRCQHMSDLIWVSNAFLCKSVWQHEHHCLSLTLSTCMFFLASPVFSEYSLSNLPSQNSNVVIPTIVSACKRHSLLKTGSLLHQTWISRILSITTSPNAISLAHFCHGCSFRPQPTHSVSNASSFGV